MDKTKQKFKRIFILSFLISIFLMANLVSASNLKAFLVEKKIDYNSLLISDGISQYIIDYNYKCYSSDFFEGQYIYIDTLIYPMFGDTIILGSFGQTKTCEVGNIPKKVNLQKYFVISVNNGKNEIVVEDKYGDKYLVEYGIGCLSMWRYENKYIDIDTGGLFLDGISDKIYLFDSGDECQVWNVKKIDNYPSIPYTPPSTFTYTPDINAPSPSTLPEINSSLNFVSPTPQVEQTPEAKPQTQQIESISEPEQKIENSTENPEKPTTASNEFQSLPEKKVTEPTLENPEEPTTISNESQFLPEAETAKPTLTSALLAMVNNVPISSWALGATGICFLIASFILKTIRTRNIKRTLDTKLTKK